VVRRDGGLEMFGAAGLRWHRRAAGVSGNGGISAAATTRIVVTGTLTGAGAATPTRTGRDARTTTSMTA